MPLLWVGQVVNTTGLMMLVPIMPFYVEQLGVSGTVAVSTWAGVAIAAPALALTFVTPLWGKVGDRVGRKWMVVRALAGLAAAMVVMATATGPVMLVAGRLLQGTLGGVVEAAAAFAGATGPRAKRGSALGKSFSATATGSLIGPLAGGLLIGTSGLGTLMTVIAGCAALAAIACARWLHEPAAGPDDPQDTATGSGSGSGSAGRGGGGDAGGPVPVSGVPYRWSAIPGAVPLAAAAAAAYFGIYGLIPIFAERVQTLEPTRAGLWVGVLQSVTWGATLLASAWWGRRNDHLGRPVATFALAAGGCAVGVIAQAFVTDVAVLIPLRLLQGLCFAALAQSMFLHVGNHAPAARRSSAVGTANSFLLAGQSAGPLLAGPLLVALTVPTVIGVMATACAAGAVLAHTAGRRPATTPPTPPQAPPQAPPPPPPSHLVAATPTASGAASGKGHP